MSAEAGRGGCEEEWRDFYLGELVGQHELGVHGRGGFGAGRHGSPCPYAVCCASSLSAIAGEVGVVSGYL